MRKMRIFDYTLIQTRFARVSCRQAAGEDE